MITNPNAFFDEFVARQVIDRSRFACELELDRRMDAETARLGIDADVDVLVAGS